MAPMADRLGSALPLRLLGEKGVTVQSRDYSVKTLLGARGDTSGLQGPEVKPRWIRHACALRLVPSRRRHIPPPYCFFSSLSAKAIYEGGPTEWCGLTRTCSSRFRCLPLSGDSYGGEERGEAERRKGSGEVVGLMSFL